ncbi:hypothetical protein JXA12_00405 [Candidatus Woesearchaeota archaeon]|nr:hypothetical protein [Candidatus Woesearchaeota archaeon]
MSFYHRAKRIAKLAIVGAVAYYAGRTCNRAAFGQEAQAQENHYQQTMMEDSIDARVTDGYRVREMDRGPLR